MIQIPLCDVKIPGQFERSVSADGAAKRCSQVMASPLGKTYPHPIILHAEARGRALATFESVKALKSKPSTRNVAPERDTDPETC